MTTLSPITAMSSNVHATYIIHIIWIKLCVKKRTQQWQHKMKVIHYCTLNP